MKSNDWKEESHAEMKAGALPMVLSMVSGEGVQGNIAHNARSTETATFDTMGHLAIEQVHGTCLQASVQQIPNHERQDAGSDKLKRTWRLLIMTLRP